jgi:hypothetical protein
MDDLFRISTTHLNKETKYGFYIGHINVGKCAVKWTTDTLVYLTDIKIEKKYRGNDLSTIFYNMVEDELVDKEVEVIELHAAELDSKKGKLTNLYKSWGFKITGKGYGRYEDIGRVIDYPMKKEL